MAKLPYSRVVNVTLSRNDRFPTRRGFGTQLILSEIAKAGQVDATYRTKLYATIDEVLADWASSTSVYKAALAAFSRNPRPLRVKVGYVDPAVATNAAGLTAQLNLINDYDTAWYAVTLTDTFRDTARLDGLVSWVQAKPKQAFIDSNAALMLSAADTTNIAARFKGTVDRTSVFYHSDASAYLASSMAGYVSTRDLDAADSAYTLKFKQAPGIAAVNVGSAALTAITGFVEGIGQDKTNGHLANTLIDIGDQLFLVEGSTLTQNVFIDEIHATDWIIARTEEEMLALYLNNPRIPFTDQGMQTLASVPRWVMSQAVRAGIVAKDLDPETGLYAPAVEFSIPSVFDVSESQRKSRIAPPISVRFRYAGAVHYSTINYNMSF